MNEFDKLHVYRLSKNRLVYFLIAILVFAIMLFLDVNGFFWERLVLFSLVSLVLFIPFTYKLTISEESISSRNLFRTQVLRWSEITEFRSKSGGVILANSDRTVNVIVKAQIENYPDVIKIIQQNSPNLWALQNKAEFHQSILESVFMLIIGMGAVYFVVFSIFSKGFFQDDLLATFVTLVVSIYIIWLGLSRVSKLIVEGDTLVVKYLLWEKQYHVSEIEAVALEQKMVKGHVRYPVHIKLGSGKQVIIDKSREGNPILLSAIEEWLNTHKGHFI